MEADWAVEVGPEFPLIDASWDGFVDLRSSSSKVDSVVEATNHPALREALLALNSEGSQVFTSKCDAWALTADEIDADEFGAGANEPLAGFASYIDILERDNMRFASLAICEQQARALTVQIRPISLRCGRVDLVVRAAIANEQSGYGLTLYAAGCGADAAAAYACWKAVLGAAVAATISAAQPPRAGE